MHSTTDRGHELPDLILPEAVRAHLSALQSQLAERDATLVERDAELKRRELKIAQLTLELAHHKRIRFGCKSEALSPEQRDLFIEASDEDGAAIVAELEQQQKPANAPRQYKRTCLLYTSDAADERSSVDLGGRRIIKKQTKQTPARVDQI